MNFLANLKIPAKILGLVMMLSVIAAGLAFVSVRTLTQLTDEYAVIVEHSQPGTQELTRMRRMTTEMLYQSYRGLAYDGGSEEAKTALERYEKAAKRAHEKLDAVREVTPETSAEVDKLEAQLNEVEAISRRAIKLGIANRKDEARNVLVEADAKMAELAKTIEDGNDIRRKDVTDRTAAAKQHSDSAQWFMILFSALGVIGGIIASLFVSRAGITGPLNRLQLTMRDLSEGKNNVDVPGTERGDEVGVMARSVLVFRDAALAQEAEQAAKRAAEAEQAKVMDTVGTKLAQVAEGDLTAEINDAFPATYATLKTNFNGAISSLRELIGSVVNSAETIRTGSGEIADASEDLARRTESNAASLEETSAAINEMEARIRATADAAQRTVQRANGTIDTVGSGRSVAEQAVQAMGRVSESAKGIDSVIEGLDKIAFQTRVLAMNAAVEAGRAGEAGRGFAVVADLVSALAMRAEEEAKRARDQLTVTQTEVGSAVEAVEKVDNALMRIVGDVDEVHKLLDGMAADNQAQSTAITQITAAIGTMDRSTQQNAAMVEEASAASRNLMSEATSLAQQTQRFKVEGGMMSARYVAPTSSKALNGASLH